MTASRSWLESDSPDNHLRDAELAERERRTAAWQEAERERREDQITGEAVRRIIRGNPNEQRHPRWPGR